MLMLGREVFFLTCGVDSGVGESGGGGGTEEYRISR